METEKTNALNEEMLNKAIRSEDNVPLVQSKVHSIILHVKMTFLIFIMALSGKIRSYLKSSGKPHVTDFGQPWGEEVYKAQRVILDLPKPITITDPITGNYLDHRVCEFYLAPSPDAPDEYRQKGPFRFRFNDTSSGVWVKSENRLVHRYDTYAMVQKAQERYLRENDWFTLLQPYTPYKGIGRTAHFFGVRPDPYAPFDNALRDMKPESFLPTDDDAYWSGMKDRNPSFGEASLIEHDLQQIINGTNPIFRDVYASKIEDVKQVFVFNDEFGYPIMKVIKRFDYQAIGTVKNYIPVTQWNQSGKPDSQYQLLPLPRKQPLYNWDKIIEADKIVLCPDLELADALQNVNSRVDIAYTAYLSNDLKWVDLEPLEGKDVSILILNHSGLTLPQVYLEAEKVYNYLKTRIKVERIRAVQALAVYPDTPKYFKSISEYMSYHRDHKKAYIEPGSIIFMDTEEEFLEMLDKAENEMERKASESQDKQFWSPEVVNVEEIAEKKHDPAKRELIRSIAARGCITYFAGATHIGKSNFIAALCAYAVNTSQRKPEFLSERCWTVCKTGSKYERLKIVHLDLENGQGGIDQREMDFVDPYMPDDKETRKACKANYIVKDLLSDSIDYSAESHFQDLCKLIDDCATNEGEKDQPVDILVIDTYWAFVHGDDTKSDVFRKLLTIYPDMAIIVLHHLNADGKSYGRQDKDFGASVVLYMERPDCSEVKDLQTPFQVRVGSKNRLTHLGVDLEPFSAKLDDNGHFVVVEPKQTKAETIKALKEGYKTRNNDGKPVAISDQELADRLGMGVEKLKKYLNEKQGGNEK